MSPTHFAAVTDACTAIGIETLIRDADSEVLRFSIRRGWLVIRYLSMPGEPLLRMVAPRAPQCPLDALQYAAGCITLATEFEVIVQRSTTPRADQSHPTQAQQLTATRCNQFVA